MDMVMEGVGCETVLGPDGLQRLADDVWPDGERSRMR